MFLHLSVCPQRGLPQCMLGYHPPPREQTPPPGANTPPGAGTIPPPSRRLLLRTVRILLESILVDVKFVDKSLLK